MFKAIQYSKDKGWSSWLDAFKPKPIELDKETIDYFTEIKKAVPTVGDGMTQVGWDYFNEKLKMSNENLLEFQKTWDGIGDPMEAYKVHLQNTGNATSKWSNIAQKAKTIAKSFGAALGSMAVNFAIGMAVEAVAKIATSYSDMVKHAQEATKFVEVRNHKIKNFRLSIIISPCAGRGYVFV